MFSEKNTPAIMLIFWIPLLFLAGVFGTEWRSGFDKILFSFPIRRSDIVAGRYLTAIISIILGILITYLLNAIFNNVSIFNEVNQLTLPEIIGISMPVLGMYCVFLPVNFKTGNRNMAAIISVAVLIISLFLFDGYVENSNNSQSTSSIWVMIIVAIIIYTISFLLSLKFNNKREF
jgi:ABC-type transport system involved in multi-copper enzyme maturation permease subunit